MAFARAAARSALASSSSALRAAAWAAAAATGEESPDFVASPLGSVMPSVVREGGTMAVRWDCSDEETSWEVPLLPGP